MNIPQIAAAHQMLKRKGKAVSEDVLFECIVGVTLAFGFVAVILFLITRFI